MSLDPDIPASSIEHQCVVVETADQFAGTTVSKDESDKFSCCFGRHFALITRRQKIK